MNLDFLENFPQLYSWLQANGTLLRYASLVSLLTFFGTILLMPILILMLPDDYFSNPGHRMRRFIRKRPLLGIMVLIIKNLTGAIFIMVGIILLFMPGQGILTILIGLIMVNFPGKYRLERRLIKKPGVLESINRIRQKFRRAAFQI